MSRTEIKHYKVANGEVHLAVSETGQGQTLLFFNGGGATQVSWKRIIGELRGQYRFVTFDFRNHGKTTRSPDVSFKGFLSDAEVIPFKEPTTLARSLDSFAQRIRAGSPSQQETSDHRRLPQV